MVHMVSVQMVSVSGTKIFHKTDRVRICSKTRYSIERRLKFSVDAQWSTVFYSRSEHGRFGVNSLFRIRTPFEIPPYGPRDCFTKGLFHNLILIFENLPSFK